MKFCPECGTHVEGMKFCPECGYSLVTTKEKVIDFESVKKSLKKTK